MTVSDIGALLWILGCVGLYLFWFHRGVSRKMPAFFLIILIALVVRFVPAFIHPKGASYEMYVFQQAGILTLNGKSVYLEPIAHPYFPLQIYWYAIAQWLAQQPWLTFGFWYKSINIIADVGILSLIYTILRQEKGKQIALFGASIYALNPVTIMVAAYQGQFDAVPTFFIILAFYIWKYKSELGWSFSLSALFMGVAIWSKTWPLIALPPLVLQFRHWHKRILYGVIAIAMPIIGIIIFEFLFPDSWQPILSRARRAGSIPGWWGYSSIANVIVTFTGEGEAVYEWLVVRGKQIALLLGAATMLIGFRHNFITTMIVVIMTLFAFIPNLGVQGLSWLVPFIVLRQSWKLSHGFIIATTIYMIIAYWGIHLTDSFLARLLTEPIGSAIIQLAAVLPWGFLVVALWHEWKQIWTLRN